MTGALTVLALLSVTAPKTPSGRAPFAMEQRVERREPAPTPVPLADDSVPAPVVRPPTIAQSLWRNARAHLDRGDIDSAGLLLDRLLKDHALHGFTESPAEAQLLVDQALSARKFSDGLKILDLAERFAPGEPHIALSRLRFMEGAEILSGALAAVGAQLGHATSRALLAGAIADAAVIAAIFVASLLGFALLFRHRRQLAHDIGTVLGAGLSRAGLPAVLILAIVLSPALAGTGLCLSAALSLGLVAAHLGLLGRIAAAVAIAGLSLPAVLAPLHDAGVRAASPGDISACVAGLCDPVTREQLAGILPSDPDHASAQLALVLADRRDGVPEGEIHSRISALARANPGNPAITVAWVTRELSALAGGCRSGDDHSGQVGKLIEALRRVETGGPEVSFNQSVLLFLVGRVDDAMTARSNALQQAPKRVERFLASLPERRIAGRPGESDPSAPFRNVCIHAFRADVELMALAPTEGGPAMRTPFPLEATFLLGSLGPIGGVVATGLGAMIFLLLTLASSRTPIAFQCVRCERAASVRRNPELAGLLECEVCLRERVVGSTEEAPQRFRKVQVREVRRRRAERFIWLTSLVIPGLAAMVVGNPLSGFLRAFFVVFSALLGALLSMGLPDAGLTGGTGALFGPLSLGLAAATALIGLVADIRAGPQGAE